MTISTVNVARSHLREVPLVGEELSADVLAAWRQCNAQFENDTLESDPDWLRAGFRGDPRDVRVFAVESEGHIVGVVPFQASRIRLLSQVGPVTVRGLPLRRLRLLGTELSLPRDERLYENVLARVGMRRDIDALDFQAVPTDSLLWQVLHASPVLRRAYVLYRSREPFPRPIVRVRGSFGEYASRFSPKSRYNRQRELRRLSARGFVQVARVTEPAQINNFLQTAAAISRRTYQYNALGLGVRVPERLRELLQFAARNGFLRSYLLTCGDTACAFIIGYQFRGRFCYSEPGYDPAWKEFSVGSVLLTKALEDLFEHDPPTVIDFGIGSQEYKHYLATETRLDGDVILFSRRCYPLLVRGLHRALRLTGRTTAALLEHLGVKHQATRILRRTWRSRGVHGAAEKH